MSDLRSQLKGMLDEFWDRNSIEAPSDDLSETGSMLVPLDSITVCEMLLDIEPLVGRDLPVERIVKKGGYQTREEFTSEVIGAVMNFLDSSS